MRGISGDARGVDFTIPVSAQAHRSPVRQLQDRRRRVRGQPFRYGECGRLAPPLLGISTFSSIWNWPAPARYDVSCRLYAPRSCVSSQSAVNVRAEEIVLTFSEYAFCWRRCPGSGQRLLAAHGIDGGKMEIAESRLAFGRRAKSAMTSKQITLRKSVRVQPQDANAKFVTDAVEFTTMRRRQRFPSRTTPTWNSIRIPAGFPGQQDVSPGLFNFQSTPESKATGKFTFYGAGSAFDQSAMLHKQVVAIGVPQSNDQQPLRVRSRRQHAEHGGVEATGRVPSSACRGNSSG